MKKVIFIIIIIGSISCEKDKIKYQDFNFVYNYFLETDEFNQILSYRKAYENNHVFELGKFSFDSSRMTFERLNPQNILIEKIVYLLDPKNLALSSIDTLFGADMIVTKKDYSYANNILLRTEIITNYHEKAQITDSKRSFVLNTISDGAVQQTEFGVYGFTSCKNLYTPSQVCPSIDVINFTNNVTGEPLKLPESVKIQVDCNWAPAWTGPIINYDYSLNEENRLIKSVETFNAGYDNDSNIRVREITIINYNYNR